MTRKLSEEHKRRISESLKGVFKGRKMSEEFRIKCSIATTGKRNPMYGKKLSVEHRKKISKAKKGKKFSKEAKRRTMPMEVRKKISASHQNCSLEDWEGFLTHSSYCPKFNNELRERIRNRDNRTCQLCGKFEILNGRRLAVHHIDGDKMQGCERKKWYLVSLCNSCNSKKDTIIKEFLIVSNIRIVKQWLQPTIDNNIFSSLTPKG